MVVRKWPPDNIAELTRKIVEIPILKILARVEGQDLPQDHPVLEEIQNTVFFMISELLTAGMPTAHLEKSSESALNGLCEKVGKELSKLFLVPVIVPNIEVFRADDFRNSMDPVICVAVTARLKVNEVQTPEQRMIEDAVKEVKEGLLKGATDEENDAMIRADSYGIDDDWDDAKIGNPFTTTRAPRSVRHLTNPVLYGELVKNNLISRRAVREEFGFDEITEKDFE